MNYASRYLPIVVEQCEAFVKRIPDGEFNMSREASQLTFDIICMILFGQDVKECCGTCEYTDPQGTRHQLQMHDALERMTADISFAGIAPINVIFPWLVEKDIGKVNRVNTANSMGLANCIREFLDKTEDRQSVYHRVLEEGVGSAEEIYADIMSFMFGGHETSSRAFTTALLQLKRAPEMLQKIREEIDRVVFENGSYAKSDLKLRLSGPVLDECEYLSMFVKEVLRFAPPAGRSLGYKTKKVVTFKDGMTVPKGEVITINVLAAHVWPEEWRAPYEFRPERFDPESEWFKRPDGQKRSANAFCPFIFGMRQCPGRALGMMELKALIIFAVTHLEWTIPERIMGHEHEFYTILSPHELRMTAKAV